MVDLLVLIDSALRGTRGAAVFLVSVTHGSLKFAGAGNIRAVIQTPEHQKTLITQNGIAGVRMGRVSPIEQTWDGQGYLILHSDGLTTKWDLTVYPGLLQRHPAVLAAVLYRDFSRGTDDSTVVVIRGQPQ